MLRTRKISISKALTIAIFIVLLQALFAQLIAQSSPIRGQSFERSQKVDKKLSVEKNVSVGKNVSVEKNVDIENKPDKEIKKIDIATLVSDAQIRTAIAELSTRHLLLPIDGISADNLKGSFYEKRGDSVHEATDIVAPRNTPIRALEDGTIAKLFLSRFGGNTIYQIDPSGKYVYYYAHLEKYEPNLKEGDKVKRGQIIGFVGTSGNAPQNTPHLHLSISVLTPDKKWWQARALDPYEVYKSNKAKQ
jgi:hypothetical protein